MRLDRVWIERHIPHRGSMCLLDEVIDWNAERISCRSSSHRGAANPLRNGGQVGIACGIEYAAQAMAVHGALAAGALLPGRRAGGLDSRPAVAGFLAGVRNVEFYVTRLDDIAGDLVCDAVRTAGDASTALYEFALRAADRRLLTGRATVLLDAQARIPP